MYRQIYGCKRKVASKVLMKKSEDVILAQNVWKRKRENAKIRQEKNLYVASTTGFLLRKFFNILPRNDPITVVLFQIYLWNGCFLTLLPNKILLYFLIQLKTTKTLRWKFSVTLCSLLYLFFSIRKLIFWNFFHMAVSLAMNKAVQNDNS